MEKLKIQKKNGSIENFNAKKIIDAVNKSAERVSVKLSNDNLMNICNIVKDLMSKEEVFSVPVERVHNFVETALLRINKDVATSYMEYRNYKQDFVSMLDELYKKEQSIRYLGDRSNSNTDSMLVSTKRSLIYNEFNKMLFRKFNLTNEEREAIEDGFIYMHDEGARRDTYNCCLFDFHTVMNKPSFLMGNMDYNKATCIEKAIRIIDDIIAVASSQQYGK